MSSLKQLRRQLVMQDESGRRLFFPLGILSRPRVIPDRVAEDWLLRDRLQVQWLVVGPAIAAMLGGLFCYVQNWLVWSMALLLAGAGGALWSTQWRLRRSSQNWERLPRLPWTHWLRLRAAGRARIRLWQDAIVWAFLCFVGVMILRTGEPTMHVLGWLQAGVGGMRLALTLGQLAFRPRPQPDPPMAC
jgi:hypothetical protein